jgi:hypothetical protein
MSEDLKVGDKGMLIESFCGIPSNYEGEIFIVERYEDGGYIVNFIINKKGEKIRESCDWWINSKTDSFIKIVKKRMRRL